MELIDLFFNACQIIDKKMNENNWYVDVKNNFPH